MEENMETQQLKGDFNQLKGQIKQTWGKLTDEDLTRLEGGAEELIGKVQKAYGYTRERAQQEFNKFKRDNPNLFRDNRENINQETRMAGTQYGVQGQMDSNKIKSRAAHLIEEDIVEPAQQYLRKAREYGSHAMDRGTELIKENPGYTILGAAAVGFLFGAYFARRR